MRSADGAEQQRQRGDEHCSCRPADVSWNGPYYARRGWVLLPEHEWGPELAAARQHERDLGLDQWPRQAKAKDLGSD